jgi:hypothetical protein
LTDKFRKRAQELLQYRSRTKRIPKSFMSIAPRQHPCGKG